MTAVVLRGDARRLPLPDASVDLVVTSPPYFGLRSYTDGGQHYAGQIGSEATPQGWLDALLGCTREWVRVLKPEGSLFVNLGDKYSGYSGANWGHGRDLGKAERGESLVPIVGPVSAPTVYGIPNKSLMGLPWRYALRCMDDLGLILRAEIIWAKPNGLPESVTDRVRRAHEQVFHFTRQPRYYSAVDEIREDIAYPDWKRLHAPEMTGHKNGTDNPLGKLPGSVWDIPSQPLTVPPSLGVDHFAAFPMELPRRVILGWSPPGVCTGCGQGRRPIVDVDRPTTQTRRIAHLASSQITRATMNGGTASTTLGVDASAIDRRIIGYACACTMNLPGPAEQAEVITVDGADERRAGELPPARPAVVLDPFGGTGTTALVASVLGRRGISVDLSADYCRLAAWRTTDPGERARALMVPKPPPVPDGQAALFDLA